MVERLRQLKAFGVESSALVRQHVEWATLRGAQACTPMVEICQAGIDDIVSNKLGYRVCWQPLAALGVGLLISSWC